MEGSTIIYMVVFILGLVVVRGYMGAVIRLALSPKERKQYITNTSFLSRWFIWSTHKWCKEKFNRYEKRKTSYAATFKLYRAMLIILHVELALEFFAELLTSIEKDLKWISDYSRGLYIISMLVTFLLCAIIEWISNPRFHRSRYR